MNKGDTQNGNAIEIPFKLDIHKGNSIPKAPRQPTPILAKKKRHNKSDLGENFIPPDGGWSWLVAIAAGISLLVTSPIMQQFGILFRDRYTQLGISSSQMTTIINTQQAVAACTGLFNGPLFRRFSYRQVSITGSLLVFLGVGLTAFADSFLLYLLTISFIFGIGRGFMTSSSSLAVNTYFKIKRRAATAYQFTVAGVGPIVLPYISTYLMVEYGVAGAVLFYGGMSLHNFACALIYQPVKWHVKKLPQDAEALRKLSEVELDHHQILGHHAEPEKKLPVPEETKFLQKSRKEFEIEEKEKKKLTVFQKISVFFDLDLLRDFTYVNLAVGLTLIAFTEINFTILTPFILHDFGFDKDQIAAAMSMLAVTDLGVRFLIPFVTGKMKCDNKVFFLVGVGGMVLGRAACAHTRSFPMMLFWFGWMGSVKAMRIVFYNLIIPSYVPLKRLPAAAGLQLLITGIFALACGPIIGLVRDATNYTFTIHVMNAMCMIVVIAWVGEDLYRKWRPKKKVEEVVENENTELKQLN